MTLSSTTFKTFICYKRKFVYLLSVIFVVCDDTMLLRIIEIIFDNTTAIILQGENLLTKVYGSLRKRLVC